MENKQHWYSSRSTKLSIAILLTASYFLVELVIGIIVGSLTLISDSFHMLSDLISMIVGLYAIRVSKKVRTRSSTYGWQRAEVVGAFCNGIFLSGISFIIFINAIERILTPEDITNPFLVLIVGIIGLAINIIGLFLFHGAYGHNHSHSHKHDNIDIVDDNVDNNYNKHNNLNIKGVFLHLLGDALGSIAVIIVGLVLYLLPDFKFGIYLDPLLTIIIVLILALGFIPLIIKSGRIMLQSIPISINIETIEKELMEIDNVQTIHELHIWQLSESKIIASCHVICTQDINISQAIMSVKEVLHKYDIHSTTIQVEQTPIVNIETECLLKCYDNTCNSKICCTEPIKD